MDFFFYGSLMDPDVLAGVLGRRLGEGRAAVLHGHRRVYVAGAWYPTVIPRPGSAVDGVLLRGLSRGDAQRLDSFEGAPYQRMEMTVSVDGAPVAAQVYRTRPGVRVSDRDWDLESWRRRYAEEYRRLRGPTGPSPRRRTGPPD